MRDDTPTAVTVVLTDGDPRPGNAAEIAPVVPAVAAALVDTLVGRRRRLAFGGPNGYRVEDEPVWLFERRGAGPGVGALLVHAGLAERCADHLRRAGLAVTVTDERRFGPPFRPDANFAGSAWMFDREFLAIPVVMFSTPHVSWR